MRAESIESKQKDNSKRWAERALQFAPYLIFAALAVWALRDVLTTPGIIGHQWDWEISAFPDQAWRQALDRLWVWDDYIDAGAYYPIKSPYYYLLTLPLSLFGGEVQSKSLVVLLLWLSAGTMYLFVQRGLRLNIFWSTITGIFYMFSPVTYSRLIAGHLPIVLGYALLPLLALFCVQIVEDKRGLPLSLVVAAGMVLGLEQALHQSLLVIASVVAAVLLFLGMTTTTIRKVFASIVAVFVIGILLNVSWVLPFGVGYLSSGSIFHGGSNQPTEQITAAGIVNWRGYLLGYTSLPMQDAMRLTTDKNPWPTEYLYPVPGNLSAFWLVVSFLLPLLAFVSLLRRDALPRSVVALWVLGLLGIVLISGIQTLAGATIYDLLKRVAFPIWAEFGNAVRALPLVVLAYAALIPFSLQHLIDRIIAWGQSRRWSLRYERVIAMVVVAALGVWTSPFIADELVRPNPMSLTLMQYPVQPADRAFYDFMKVNPTDARMTVIPPPGIWGAAVGGWDWEVGATPPRPKFLAPSYNPDVWHDASDFGFVSANTRAGKLLGLAAVQYVVYPYAQFFDHSPLKPLFDARLARQQDLQPVTLPFTGTTIYQNDAALPRIYTTNQSVAVAGDSDLLTPLSTTPYFSRAPVFFFSAQQPTSAWQSLTARSAATLASIDFTPAVTTVTPLADTAAAAPVTDPMAYLAALPQDSIGSVGTLAITHAGQYVVNISAKAIPAFDANAGLVFTQTVPFLTEAPQQGTWQIEPASPPLRSDLSFSADVPYSVRAGNPSGIDASVWLDDSTQSDPYAEVARAVPPFDLHDMPNIELVSQAQDPTTQMIKVRLGLAFNGGNTVDAWWTLPVVPRTDWTTSRVALLDGVKSDFPTQSDFRVVAVALRFTKRPKVNLAQAGQIGLYAYQVKSLSFYSDQSTRALSVDLAAPPANSVLLPQVASSVAGISLTWPISTNAPVRVSRALPNIPSDQQPAYALSYQVDGPATLAVDLRVIGTDAAGASQSIALEPRVLPPFSHGTLLIDVPQPFTATRIELTASKMIGTAEPRATTLTLEQFSVARRQAQPYANARPSAPDLKVDGESVVLSPMPSDASRTGAWFTSPAIDLAQGNHSIAIGYADATTPYRVDVVTVAPAHAVLPALPAPTVTFREINPTRFVAYVENATAPFFLVFSESFDAGWEARILNGGVAALAPHWYDQSALLSGLFQARQGMATPDHYLANGFSNGWYITQTGSYDVVIEFMPQRLYETGLVLSFGTLIACIMVLFVVRLRRRVV